MEKKIKIKICFDRDKVVSFSNCDEWKNFPTTTTTTNWSKNKNVLLLRERERESVMILNRLC